MEKSKVVVYYTNHAPQEFTLAELVNGMAYLLALNSNSEIIKYETITL